MAKSNIFEYVREDDFVEYFLFPNSTINDKKEEELMINSVLREAKAILKKYCRNYIWHKDEFTLKARTSISNVLSNDNTRENLPCHLYGISHYGDFIEDEWFIVYLLIQLSKEIEGLICRIVDIDGEFLLIEAAEQLAEWAKPETCVNRVYIYKGYVHIVAPEVGDENNEINIQEALNVIRTNPNLTIASTGIQDAIQRKIQGYPDRILENLHRTKVYLPIGIAAILKHKPNLLSPAIHAFINRDSIDMKTCRAMKFFPPENRVFTSLTFTKCLYAMLVHSKYLPDRKTGWNLPLATSPQYKSHLLGVKIACGFEILASQAKLNGDSIEGDKAWHTYINSLKARNYFNDLLEHSQEYNHLMNKAKDYYREHRDSMHCAPTIGKEILDLSRNLDLNLDEFNESDLPDDDDEEWLNITPEELDRMLIEQYGQKNVAARKDVSNFAHKITSFLEQISDVDGAEFPHQPINQVRQEVGKPATQVNFDSNGFSCAVQNILNFVIPEDESWDLESDSDMDDYAHEEAADCDELKSKMKEYMNQMDAELAQTTIGKSFETKTDNFDDIETFQPVDIDVNALKNILESYKLQMGEAGPSSNMLGPMGVHLEQFEQLNCDSD